MVKTLKKHMNGECMEDLMPEGFVVINNQQIINHYNIFLNDFFEHPNQFIEAVSILELAQEPDTITIHLTSGGGNIDAVDGFLAAMEDCEAEISVKASGIVASAATLVLLTADSIQITPFTEVLIHSASFGSSGKSQDVYESVTFQHKQCEKLLRHYCRGFLTDDEFHDVICNKREMLLTADDFIERFQKRNEYLAKELDEQC